MSPVILKIKNDFYLVGSQKNYYFYEMTHYHTAVVFFQR